MTVSKSRRLTSAKHKGQGLWPTCEIYLPGSRGHLAGTYVKQNEFLRVLRQVVDEAVVEFGGETRWYNGK